jgi:tRNA1(Val) A37 N6-methylase TrmN6
MDLPKQDLAINLENKQQFGEVHTPYSLIEKMFGLLPESLFSDPTKRWLDPGAGHGYFSLFLYHKLMAGLVTQIPDNQVRSTHILKNMIWIVEINSEHSERLKTLFLPTNIITSDFLTVTLAQFSIPFDIIIGNPPFNSGGLKKVPSNHERSKKLDGKTVWSQFIKHSISLLREKGLLLFIVPSIWMKEDKEGMYFYMTQFKLHKIHCLTNTEMNQYFKGHAQTPACYFLLEKKSTDKKVLLYDKDYKTYIDFPFREENILPVACSKLLMDILPYIDKYGSLEKMMKSNLPPKQTCFSPIQTPEFHHPNIKTCILSDKIQPELVIDYSDNPCPFYSKKKLVLAHGMYGFPYIDRNAIYGISNRDKYIYLSDDIEELERLHQFLSTDLVFYLLDATRYRMKYLEKYIFRYLPNILKMEPSEVIELLSKIKVPFSKNKYKHIV